ncbi:MAG: DNA topoisomerase 3 [Deltaproteobacteria bacterium]|nr:DNA topoisomerase 3 [Deltaproteobacteria bacterium]
MPHRLIVTEKPSVARDIARVLGLPVRGPGFLGGNGPVRISWCLGHLTELAEPASYDSAWKAWRMDALPMLPDPFKLQPRKSSMDQWRILKGLLVHKDLGEVVNACDAGREGELIFANTYRLAGCKAPVQRLWISSMTPAAIKGGFDSLRPGATMANLEAAARCRSEADWLVGLNATRAMTVQLRDRTGGTLLSLGRVQTPTLALMVNRENAIRNFEPQDFWKVLVTFGVEEGTWEAAWIGPVSIAGTPRSTEATPADPDEEKDEHADDGKITFRIWDEETANTILGRIAGKDGVVVRAEGKKTREKPPLLYDLTALQKEANKRFKFSAQRTLDIAQALYEQKKVITYPRTDSRHLSKDQVPGLPKLVQGLRFGPYQKGADDVMQRWPVKLTKRVVDDNEVSDHHAIIPTGVDPRKAGLDPDQKRLFDLVARRFLAVFHPDAVFANQTVDVAIGEDRFRAKGRSMLEPGWRAIDPPKSTRKDKGLLPKVEKGDEAKHVSSKLHKGTTRAPKRYTEATLLGAMERAGDDLGDAELKRAMKKRGLGTPATRASVIETLLSRTYIERHDADLVPTDAGMALIEVLPIDSLRSAKLTGEWEARLVAIADGEDDRDAFMADIRRFTQEAIDQVRGATVQGIAAEALTTKRVADGPLLGTCPLCQGEVRESRKGWACNGCTLWIPPSIASRDLSPRMAKQLLKDRTTKPVKGWKSKAGKAFTAGLTLTDDAKISFHFPESEALGDCLKCSKPVRRRGKVWTCDGGRDCPFVVFGEMSGRQIQESDVSSLLAEQQGPIYTDFHDRDGNRFPGRLRWNGARVVVGRVDLRAEAGPVGACPTCSSEVAFRNGRWACTQCRFSLPEVVMNRPLLEGDVRQLLATGSTSRVYGFRQQGGGPVIKAAMVLDGGRVRVDYTGEHPDWDEQPLPPGAPTPALGKRLVCPSCRDGGHPLPGYVIAGREAWGCSRWREGCRFRLPFSILGKRLSEEEARRLLGKHRATVYSRRPVDTNGRVERARVALHPHADPTWEVQIHGAQN